MSSAALSPFLPSWQPQRPNRRTAAAVLALHVAAIALLLQAGRTVAAQLTPPPVTVALLQDAPPAPPLPTPRPAAPQLQLPTAHAIVLPLPEIAVTTPAREVQVSAPPPAPAPVTETAPQRSAALATPPQPKAVAASSLRWRVEPAVELPRLSRRAGEQGRVQLSVQFDTEGRPQAVQMLRSSGFARLDAQALEAIRVARITPYLEDGRMVAVSTVVNLEYELE